MRIFSVVAAILNIVTLGPKVAIGLAEVPSLTTTIVIHVLVASVGGMLNFHVAFFLALSSGMAYFPFELSTILPFLVGVMSGTLPQGHSFSNAYSFHN